MSTVWKLNSILLSNPGIKEEITLNSSELNDENMT